MCLTLQVWKRPSITTKTAPIDFETKCPNVRAGQRAALHAVPPFRVSPQDNGRRFIRLNEGGFTVRLSSDVSVAKKPKYLQKSQNSTSYHEKV